MIDLNLLKKLRNETSMSISDCRTALEAASGNFDQALEHLKKRAAEISSKKQDRETGQGLIEAYIHQNGKAGALVELLCETDFVARTDDFKTLAHSLAMQVVAMNPENVGALLKQDYIKDAGLTIAGLIKHAIGKLGENISLKRFQRFEI